MASSSSHPAGHLGELDWQAVKQGLGMGLVIYLLAGGAFWTRFEASHGQSTELGLPPWVHVIATVVFALAGTMAVVSGLWHLFHRPTTGPARM